MWQLVLTSSNISKSHEIIFLKLLINTSWEDIILHLTPKVTKVKGWCFNNEMTLMEEFQTIIKLIQTIRLRLIHLEFLMRSLWTIIMDMSDRGDYQIH